MSLFEIYTPDIYAIRCHLYVTAIKNNFFSYKTQGKGNGKQTSLGVATEMKLCGRNNHTYNSWCQMIKDSCNTGFFIDIEHNGECSALNSKFLYEIMNYKTFLTSFMPFRYN